MTAGMQRARTMTGAIVWLGTLAYFGVQLWVARAWVPPYDLVRNTISDLGVTSCGTSAGLAGEVYACSPRHLAMNVGFIVAGVLTAVGALLLHRLWPDSKRAMGATAGLVLAGIGGVLVGLAPSDEAVVVHTIGAGLQVPGAVAPLLLGLAYGRRRVWFAGVSIAAGVLGIVGAALLVGRIYLADGPGIMERIFIETHTVWTGGVGLGLLIASRSRPGASPSPATAS